MNRETALAIVREFVQSDGLRKHMAAVGVCMAAYANRFGEDPEKWEVTGILHDFDWEIHPVLPDHPTKGEAILAARGVSEEIRQAILSHADFTGVPRQTPMEKALFACDELAGFITAVTYVKPSRSVHDADAAGVIRKMKDKAFARAVSRDDIRNGAAELGIPLEEHVAFCIQAMRDRAAELGLEGNSLPQ
jgi:predicted hydrolase (HD superfamily)